MRLIRDIAAVIVSIALFGLVPIYGAPFGDCMELGFRTFATGCSSWPEFLRGFMFIGAMAVISVHKKSLSAFGLTAVLLVVMAGGVALIRTGEAASYFQSNYLALSEHIRNPLLFGAFAASLMHIAIIKLFRPETTNVDSAGKAGSENNAF